MKLQHAFTFLVLSLCITIRCFAGAGIGPLVVHLEDSEKTASIVVENTTDRSRDIDIELLGENGTRRNQAAVRTGAMNAGTAEGSVYPDSGHFTLGPGERRTVRFESRIPGNGDYGALFAIESRPGQDSIPEGTYVFPATISLVARVGLEIRLRTLGEAAKIAIQTTDLPKILSLVVNTSMNGVSFDKVLVRFRNQHGFVAAWFERKVLSQTKMSYTIDLASIPPGSYTTEIQLRTNRMADISPDGLDIALRLP